MNDCLPAMASHAALGAAIERQETLISSVLLSSERGLCGLFLSVDASGEFRLRRCEGYDDAWMVWREQRRLRSGFGRSYAEAVTGAALARLEREGWRVDWLARRHEPASTALAA